MFSDFTGKQTFVRALGAVQAPCDMLIACADGTAEEACFETPDSLCSGRGGVIGNPFNRYQEQEEAETIFVRCNDGAFDTIKRNGVKPCLTRGGEVEEFDTRTDAQREADLAEIRAGYEGGSESGGDGDRPVSQGGMIPDNVYYSFASVGSVQMQPTSQTKSCPTSTLDKAGIESLAIDWARDDFYQSRPKGTSLANNSIFKMLENCDFYQEAVEIANRTYTQNYDNMSNFCPVNENITPQDYAEKMKSFTSYGFSSAYDDFYENKPRGTSLNKQKLFYGSCTKYPELLENFSNEYNRVYDNLEESEKLGQVVGGVDGNILRNTTTPVFTAIPVEDNACEGVQCIALYAPCREGYISRNKCCPNTGNCIPDPAYLGIYRILVRYESSLSAQEIETIEKEFDLQRLNYIPTIYTGYYEISSLSSLDGFYKLMERLRKKTGVVLVEEDLVRTQIAAPALPIGQTPSTEFGNPIRMEIPLSFVRTTSTTEPLTAETSTTETPATEEPKQGGLGILAIGLIALKVLAT